MSTLHVTPLSANKGPKSAVTNTPSVTVREIEEDHSAETQPSFPKRRVTITQSAPAKSAVTLRCPPPVRTAGIQAISLTVPDKTATTVQPTPKTEVSPARSSTLHLTALGAQILSSSTNPVASVDPPHKAILTKITPSSGHSAQQTAIPVIAIADSTAPKNQKHAKVWQDALKAAQTGSPVEVNNETLQNPSLASADANNKMFKISLADLVKTGQGGSVAVQGTAAPPLIVPAGVNQDVLAKAELSLAGVQLPDNLLAHTDTGVETPEDATTTTPSGFVLTGDSSQLFGLLDAERFTFHGNASPDGKVEMMIPSAKEVTLDQLFGSDKVAFGGMKLSSASVSLYTKSTAGGRQTGVWLDATLAITDKLSELAADLKGLLGHESLEIKVSGWLGQFTNWSTALVPPEQITLQGSIPQVNALLGKHVTFASASVDCQAVKGTQTQNGKQVYTWTYTISGNLNLTVPGSVIPLSMDYILAKSGTLYTLKMHLDEKNTWNNAMGVHGMHLFDVDIVNVFDKSKADGRETFDLKAQFKTDALDLNVTGSYGGDGWSLNAACPSLSWDELDALFKDMFDSKLQPFHHSISLDDLTLEASSAKKEISLKSQLTVDKWKAADAEISLSSDGFHLSVKELDDIDLDMVKLKKGSMEIFVGKAGNVDADPKKPGTASSFTINGEIMVSNRTIEAIAYLDKEGSNSDLTYVICAECEKIQLSNLMKLGARSDLDLILENVVVMAANTSKLGANMPTQFKYPVKPGFFLSAQADAPPALTKAVHSGPKSIRIELDLSQGSKQLDFVFGSPQALVLKRGMSAPVVTAGIIFNDPPELFVEADMPVLLRDQAIPLDFQLKGTVSPTEASLEASLQTDWVNPFGVSPHVTILAPFELGVKIIYISEFYPSGIDFSGNVMIGETKLEAVFDVTDSPTEGVIFLEEKNLGIKDIIAFASKVVEHDLPQPSSDFLEFQKLNLAISTGASVEGVYYPAGVTYDAKMLIFNKLVEVSAQMIKSPPKLSVAGSIQAFELGPLSVTGHSGKDLSVALDFGKDLQRIAIDGEIRLWKLDVGVTLRADLHPLNLYIEADLDFCDVLKFHLMAQIEGEVKSLKELGKCDFTFEATLEQHIVEYIMAHANSYILTAKKAADEGISTAEAKLDEAQKNFVDVINRKQAELNATKAAWDKQSTATLVSANARKAKVADDEAWMRKSVDDAKKKFDDAISKLEAKLTQTKQTADAEIKKAESELNTEKTKIDADVNAKVQRLQQAQSNLSHSFGDADTALKNAENKVNDAQRLVNNKGQEIDSAKNDLAHASFFHKLSFACKLAGLESEKVGLEAALKIVQGALAGAKAVVDGPAYHLAKDGVKAAEDALEAAKKVGDDALRLLQATLDKTIKVQNGLLDAASKDLEAAKKECDESKLWDTAKKALETFLQTKAALIADADKAVAALATCAEKIVFDAATAALNVARAGTKEIDVARDALVLAKDATDGVAKLGSWMVEHVGNIFNITSVKISGRLSQGKDGGTPLKAEIDGVFADKALHLEADFTPGKAEEMLKQVFACIMADVKKDAASFVKKL